MHLKEVQRIPLVIWDEPDKLGFECVGCIMYKHFLKVHFQFEGTELAVELIKLNYQKKWSFL